jgi:hypothetical protein
MAKNWTIRRLEHGVHRVEFTGVRPSLWVFLSADWHWDNPKSRWDCIERDLKMAKRLDALVVSCGDHLCLMQGKYDKRSNKDSIRPEHQAGSYIDRVVDTAAEFLTPYADQMGLISVGNHESAIYNRHETCVTTRLVERLRLAGSQCHRGGYNGWLQFCARPSTGKSTSQWRLYYHHGSGGDSPVTQGLIGMNRVTQYVDADCVLSGHIHARNLSTVCRERLSSHGIRRVSETTLVRCSTYKDEWSPLVGWHVEQGRGPRPTLNPGYWLNLKQNSDRTAMVATFHDRPPLEDTDGPDSYPAADRDDDDHDRGDAFPEPGRRKRSTAASGGRASRKAGSRSTKRSPRGDRR